MWDLDYIPRGIFIVDQASETVHNGDKTGALLRKFEFRVNTTACLPTGPCSSFCWKTDIKTCSNGICLFKDIYITHTNIYFNQATNDNNWGDGSDSVKLLNVAWLDSNKNITLLDGFFSSFNWIPLVIFSSLQIEISMPEGSPLLLLLHPGPPPGCLPVVRCTQTFFFHDILKIEKFPVARNLRKQICTPSQHNGDFKMQ